MCYGLGVVMPGKRQIDAVWFGSLGLLFRNHTGPPQPFLKQHQHISKASSLIHRLHPERDGFCACVCMCVCACVHTYQARGDGTVTINVKKQSNGRSLAVGGYTLKPSCSRELHNALCAIMQ